MAAAGPQIWFAQLVPSATPGAPSFPQWQVNTQEVLTFGTAHARDSFPLRLCGNERRTRGTQPAIIPALMSGVGIFAVLWVFVYGAKPSGCSDIAESSQNAYISV